MSDDPTPPRRFEQEEKADHHARVVSVPSDRPLGSTAERQPSNYNKEQNMSRDELRQEAMTVLSKAFKGEDVPVHVVQAATSIILTPEAK